MYIGVLTFWRRSEPMLTVWIRAVVVGALWNLATVTDGNPTRPHDRTRRSCTTRSRPRPGVILPQRVRPRTCPVRPQRNRIHFRDRRPIGRSEYTVNLSLDSRSTGVRVERFHVLPTRNRHVDRSGPSQAPGPGYAEKLHPSDHACNPHQVRYTRGGCRAVMNDK